MWYQTNFISIFAGVKNTTSCTSLKHYSRKENKTALEMNISDLPRNSLGDLSKTPLSCATLILQCCCLRSRLTRSASKRTWYWEGLNIDGRTDPMQANCKRLEGTRLGVNYNHNSGLLSSKTVCFLKERVPCLIDFYQYKSNCFWILRPRKQFFMFWLCLWMPCED